ncbi:RNA-directed DNA polymerase, eukaryota, partial [Tanacetum coccineum]
VVPLQPRRYMKIKTVVVDTSGPSNPPKKLRKDYETPGGPSVAGKSRFVISSDSSHYFGANIAEAEEKTIKPSVFAADSSSSGGDPDAGVFSNLTGSDFLVSGIRTVIDPESNHQKVYVPRWSMTNGSQLDDGRVCRDMVDEFAPPKFLGAAIILDVSSYENDITVRAAMILANVSIFTPKLSKHYLNITKRNVVEIFRKDTVSLA